MGRSKAPCGTDAAYRRHLREGTPVDDACQAAHTEAGRRYRQAALTPPATPTERAAATDEDDETDDMQLIVDSLRIALKAATKSDPTKIAPIAREFRFAVEAARGPVEAPKEKTLAEQLAEARAARAARAAG